MSLAAGSKLGPYEILAPLGAGGMGEVYRARDTRLHRTVAIKLVRHELARRSDFRERFQREARAISALNHPHICSLYDIGEQDGLDYLVMEYVEGESLAEMLKRDRLPLDQALRLAIAVRRFDPTNSPSICEPWALVQKWQSPSAFGVPFTWLLRCSAF